MNETDRIEAEILRLCEMRGAGKSICPTDAAKSLGAENWRAQLHKVRIAAIKLARAGRIDILRKGKPVPPEDIRGVIRLRLRGDSETEA